MRVLLLLILVIAPIALAFNPLSSKDWVIDLPWLKGPYDKRPLGTWDEMLYGGAAYIAILTVFSALMYSRRNAKPEQPLNFIVRPVSIVQNFIMCLYSLYVFYGTALVLYENWSKAGFDLLLPFCDPKRKMVVNLDFWMYHFYLSKFVEILDSVLLILRAKPLFPPGNSQYFLHVFHHAVTPSIVWIAWRIPFSGAWVGPLSNGFVHFWMYGYYFLTDFGLSRSWGVFVTPIQLVQFVLAMLTITYESFNVEACGSTPFALAWMWFTYAVFLAFFIKLYLDKMALFGGKKEAAKAAPKGKKKPE